MLLKETEQYKEVCRLLKLEIGEDGLPYIVPWYVKLWRFLRGGE